MKDILDKITSYNLFNYLFPGIVFVVLLSYFTRYSLIQEDLVVGVFVYYFIGLVVSRLGSLIIEPALKKVGFLKFTEYKDFIAASKKDSKLEILSETNNMYRTLCSVFALLLLVKIYETVIPESWTPIIVMLLLLIMFLFSYRKQTQYIEKRVNRT